MESPGPTRRATVHRTIAFNGSNLNFTILQNKKDIRMDVLETVKKLPVIANQSADWCGDPLVL